MPSFMCIQKAYPHSGFNQGSVNPANVILISLGILSTQVTKSSKLNNLFPLYDSCNVL